MGNEARLQEELIHARRRIARLEGTIRCLKDGRRLTPRDAIDLAVNAHDVEGVLHAVGSISSWFSEREVFDLRESWNAQAATWDEPDPDLQERVNRVLRTAEREIHEFAQK